MQKGLFNPHNAQAVELGRAKGRAAGKGVKRQRMSTAEKARRPQGLCSGSCGKQGVVGMKHSMLSKEQGKVEACGYFCQHELKRFHMLSRLNAPPCVSP
jgi:hypothetical protein